MDQQRIPAFFGQFQRLHEARNEGTVEDAVIVHLFRVIVVDHPHGAQRFHPRQKRFQHRFVFHEQAHLERLIGGAVLLGADIGNIQPKFADEPQHLRHTAGHVLQMEFQQHDALIVLRRFQIPDLRKLLVRLKQLRFAAFRVDKQGVGIHRLVIAHAGDVDAQ